MYELPTLEINEAPARKQTIDFGGYNDAPIIDDGDMRDMKNLSSDSYPFITQRQNRGIYKAEYIDGIPTANVSMFDNPTAILSRREKLAVIDGSDFYYGEDEYGSPILIDYLPLSDAPDKNMVAINNKICIFPDKVWFDVRDASELGENEHKWGKIANTVSIYKTTSEMDVDGTWGRALRNIERDAEATDQILEFTAVTPPPSEAGYYDAIRIMPGDAVSLSGFANAANNITAVVQKVELTKTYGDGTTDFYEYDVKLHFPASSFEAVDAATEDYTCIRIERKCPDLSHVMEHDNRLWGTCDEENAIYACKQGDPTNWYYYREALSSNSYAVQVATDGAWTGCCAYGAHLLFFKEDYIHRIYGNKPANYSLNTIEAQSVEQGSSRSIVVVNNTVFYKSRLGIMAYAGGVPELVSDNFGTAKYKNVVAGTNGMKLYFSMESVERPGEWDFMVFDVHKVKWHKEDNTHAVDFAYHNGKMIYVEAGKRYLMVVDADVPVVEIESELDDVLALRYDPRIDWMAVFGDFDEYIEDKKIYSKMQLRMKMSDGSAFTISVMCDDSGNWEEVLHMYSETRRSVYVPIIPRRCDKFRIKIEGRGRVTIESLAREYHEGSEV